MAFEEWWKLQDFAEDEKEDFRKCWETAYERGRTDGWNEFG